jgi:exonuclease SbcC
MIFEELEILNFGKHKKIVFPCNSPVIGIMGPNGSGKSTVLDALQFAVTGTTRDPMDTYVRNYDGNASVKARFRKNGKIGSIFRQFGKTAKRQLIWDNQKPKTAAKEVDQTMSDIFGVDKEAIANAVFIPQGSLSKILFSGDANRRDLFINLVNMSYCEGRARVLDGKIKKIQATITDLTAAKDEANAVADEAALNLKQKSEVLAQLTNLSGAIQQCDQWIEATNNQEHHTRELGRLQNEAAVVQQQLQDALAPTLNSNNPCPTVHAVRTYVEHLRTAATQQRNQLQEKRSIAAELVNYRSTLQRINEIIGQITQLDAELQTLNPENKTPEELQRFADALGSRINRLRPYLDKVNRHAEYTQQLTELERAVREANVAIQNAEADPQQNRIFLESKRRNLGQNQSALTQMERFHALRAEMLANKCLEGKSSCPKCGLTIHDPQLVSESAQTQLGADIDQLKFDIEQTRKEIETLEQFWHNLLNTQHATTHNLRQHQAAMERLRAEMEKTNPGESESLERLVQQHQDTLARAHRLPPLLQQKAALGEQYRQLLVVKGGFTKAPQYLEREAEFADALLHTEQQALDYAVELEKRWATFLEDLVRIESRHTTLLEQITTARQKIDEANLALQNLALDPIVKTLTEQLGSIKGTKMELQRRQEEYNTAEGQQKEADANYQRALQKVQEIQNRMSRDEGKRRLIADLVRTKEILMNDGLPMSVVRQYFERLAVLTQESLVKLNANFAIQIDKHNELSFTFIRLDEVGAIELPMVKLSGGQRVRLCLAFLMAVQKVLVREVGLLVLDEPSVHVDEAGVESLVELLRELNVALRGTETQIFVVDHHPVMYRAFDKVLNLPLEEEERERAT